MDGRARPGGGQEDVGDAAAEGTIDISFLSSGAFNKLYTVSVSIDSKACVLRISLPVDPRQKTLSEVATLDWVRQNTNIPVPRVMAFEATRTNPVGFEWILMTKIDPGTPLAKVWNSLSFPAKKALTEWFADYSSSLFKKQLSGIGNLYPQACKTDRIVSKQFVWGDRIHQDMHRGPFSSSTGWLEARLALSEHDCCSTLAKYSDSNGVDSDEEAERDDAKRTLGIIQRLAPVVRRIFPVDHPQPEPSMLFHDNLTEHKILVDDSGVLTGVVDWECVSFLPLWKACDYPAFLGGPPRDEEPNRTSYYHGDDGKPTELYWMHLKEYELTNLRRFFLNEMTRREPRWVAVFEASVLQRDLDIAVQNCGSEFLAKCILGWIDDVEAGTSNMRSLLDRINH